ncbi:type III secretion system chaperone [Bordetella genomosp. 13]|uniref:type III secretion system chaperone n=1 Tax=Bordetella genomosp. 13 TaxID=463040 RepID=UPI001643142F|nr:type III secretion system chaperone [Bordetella genomosp. 13]
MTFAQLLAALGMETKLDLNAAVQTGGCTIQFDQSLELTLEFEADSGNLQLYVTAAQAPPTNREAFFAALLQLHLFGMATEGGVFGFDPQLDRVLFFKTLSLPSLDEAAALGQVEVFVNQAERWRARLLDIVARVTPAVGPSGGNPLGGNPLGGMPLDRA